MGTFLGFCLSPHPPYPKWCDGTRDPAGGSEASQSSLTIRWPHFGSWKSATAGLYSTGMGRGCTWGFILPGAGVKHSPTLTLLALVAWGLGVPTPFLPLLPSLVKFGLP